MPTYEKVYNPATVYNKEDSYLLIKILIKVFIVTSTAIGTAGIFLKDATGVYPILVSNLTLSLFLLFNKSFLLFINQILIVALIIQNIIFYIGDTYDG